MTCAKRRVICVIATPGNRYVFGSNDCRNPQPTCPREPGEDYTKCRTICDQEGHAEIVALIRARERGLDLKHAVAQIEGINHVCRECANALTDAGVSSYTVTP